MRLSIMAACVVAAFFALSGASCKKEHIYHLPADDTTTVDSTIAGIAYPYTDTFSGELKMLINYGPGLGIDYTFVDPDYHFYVKHSSFDSLTFISEDTIKNIHVPFRYFCNSYAFAATSVYKFKNYFYVDNQQGHHDIDSSGSFNYSGLNLDVNWVDLYWNELRLSEPTGGMTYREYRCSYKGRLVRN